MADTPGAATEEKEEEAEEAEDRAGTRRGLGVWLVLPLPRCGREGPGGVAGKLSNCACRGEHRTQNTEHRTQSTEHRTQSTMEENEWEPGQ